MLPKLMLFYRLWISAACFLTPGGQSYLLNLQSLDQSGGMGTFYLRQWTTQLALQLESTACI